MPLPDSMPAGPLASEYVNPRLLSRGLLTPQELTGYFDEVERRRVYPLPLGDRMRMLFHSEFPGVLDVHQRSVWCVGDLLRFGGNFDRFVRAAGSAAAGGGGVSALSEDDSAAGRIR